MASKMRVHISADVKRQIRNAQRRLRNAPDFMKELAKQQGLDGITTRGTVAEVAISLRKAQRINETAQFTKRGFARWEQELASDTSLNIKTIKYALSQIDAEKMDYINNSRLRFGSNPQLDYIIDSAIEVRNSLKTALDGLTGGFEDDWEIF